MPVGFCKVEEEGVAPVNVHAQFNIGPLVALPVKFIHSPSHKMLSLAVKLTAGTGLVEEVMQLEKVEVLLFVGSVAVAVIWLPPVNVA
jgi:hypothetical protein